MNETQTCDECGEDIDPTTCWCGEEMDGHSGYGAHAPTPRGCRCCDVDESELDVAEFMQLNGVQ